MENCNEIVKKRWYSNVLLQICYLLHGKGIFLSQVPGRATDCPIREVENLVVKGSSQQSDMWFGLFIGLAVCNVCMLANIVNKKVKK